MSDQGLRSKYFGGPGGVQDRDLYGGNVAGFVDGFPVRGQGGPITQIERDSLPLACDFKARWFRTWDLADVELYVKVQDHVANGDFFVRSRTEVSTIRDGEPYLKIWLEWVQVYADRRPSDGFQPGAQPPTSLTFGLEG